VSGKCQLGVFEGMGQFGPIFNVKVDITKDNIGIRKLHWLSFIRRQNIGSSFFSFVTMHASDRQIDERTIRILTSKTTLSVSIAL